MRANDFVATASADNATATATQAAVAGKRHHITGVIASFGAAAIKLLTVKKGTTTILERYVHNAADLQFDHPIMGDLDGAVSAELAASGTAGVLGKVALLGYTEG